MNEDKNLLILQSENIENMIGDVDYTEWLFSKNSNVSTSNKFFNY